MKMKLAAKLTLLTLMSTSAMAVTQEVDIDLHSGIYARGEMVPLRQMLNQRLGAQAVQGWDVLKVDVTGKSKQGMGEVSLSVNQQESLSQVLPGTPETFDTNYSGFTKVTLPAPRLYRGQETRRVQLHTRGIVKLDKVEVLLKKQLRYDHTNVGGMLFTQVAEFKATKIIGNSKNISVNGRLSGIQLLGTKRNVKVDKVEIEFMNGQKIIVDELHTKLKEGRSVSFALRGMMARPVRSVKVSATSTKLFGGSGRLAVLLSK